MGTPFGRYELLAQLARGGLAEIWLARQTGLAGFEKLVVVKRLYERLQKEQEFVDMFLDEARINSRLNHTNVLSVHELGEIDGRYFLTMEYIEGMPLGLLSQRAQTSLGDLPIAIIGGLLSQAAAGLHYAHEARSADGAPLNIVHRDVSPLNLLLSYEGVLKLADFGIAKADGRTTKTRSGVIKGTPTYMSPEQCTGEAVDRRSDVFGLGILFWELLTGKRLFRREYADQVYSAIVSGQVAAPSTHRPELPSALDAIALRALARRPADRFQTAEEFRRELEAVLQEEGLRAEVVDVRNFLEEHFAQERKDQESLIRKAITGSLGAQTAPLFKHADHGVDSDEIIEIEFSDGDTTRDSQSPQHVEELPSPEEANTLRQRPPIAGNTPLPAAAPPPRRLPIWVIVLVVALATAVAATAGLVAGRHVTHKETPR
jgi:serine/threonine-protein kinase